MGVAPADELFARIALKNQLVNEEKLDECLALIQRGNGRASLGEILLEKRYINEKHFKLIQDKIENFGWGVSLANYDHDGAIANWDVTSSIPSDFWANAADRLRAQPTSLIIRMNLRQLTPRKRIHRVSGRRPPRTRSSPLPAASSNTTRRPRSSRLTTWS